MTDHNQAAVRDDISFLRTLAEEGRDAPLNGGASLASAGTIFGAASAIAVWGGFTGRLAGPWIDPALFLGAGVLHAAVMWRLKSAPSSWRGAGSRANAATNIAWTGVALTVLAGSLGLLATGLSTHNWAVMLALPLMVFAAYGAAWTVAAFMSGQRWLWAVALASFAVAVGLGAVAGSGVIFYSLFVAAVFALVALPGFILMAKARRAA